jgi:HAD superfamily hydrolase (TIGR01509 family)
MKPELVVFDFDGVLIDSEVLWSESLAAVLARLGRPLSVLECRRRFTGISGRDVRNAIIELQGEALPDDFEPLVKEDAYARLAGKPRMVPGADSLLEGLDGPRCIASNSGHAWIDLGLRGAGIDRFFPADRRFSAAQVARGKPAPDVYLLAAQTMKVAPEQCIVVEDNIHGVAAARTAGMTVIGFTGGSHIEDGYADELLRAGVVAILEELPGLPDLVESL